jgi:cyclohexyl-isocyanide hydratase
MAESMHAGMVLFPGLTQLDVTGPFEVLARVPGLSVHLIAASLEPVRSDTGLRILPTATFESAAQLDILCVPGGPGVNEAMLDEELLAFVRRQAAGVRYLTSVCSGALILGAAGLLEGRRATTHWASAKFLPEFGATYEDVRVCRDDNLITGGGVTAGLDFGLVLAGILAGDEVAQKIQLALQYSPEPPFDSGTPGAAAATVRARYDESAAPMLARRAEAVRAAAVSLKSAK